MTKQRGDSVLSANVAEPQQFEDAVVPDNRENLQDQTKLYQEESWQERARKGKSSRPEREKDTRPKRRLPHSSEEGSEEEDVAKQTHIQKIIKANDAKMSSATKFECHICKSSLSSLYNLKRHKRKVHGIE